jgi:hypothetical protein
MKAANVFNVEHDHALDYQLAKREFPALTSVSMCPLLAPKSTQDTISHWRSCVDYLQASKHSDCSVVNCGCGIEQRIANLALIQSG